MKLFKQDVMGRTATIKVVESVSDYTKFLDWMTDQAAQGRWFACDTETTGLDIFSDDFRVRTLQLGVGLEAWVIPLDHFIIDQAEYLDLGWLKEIDLTFHNAAFDVLAIGEGLGIKLDWDRITDTKILAHLYDSRAVREGGTGHSLQELTAAYIDKDVAAEVKGSMQKMANESKLKVGEVFAQVDVWNETYLRYAGMDVILTYALRNILRLRLDQMYKAVPQANPGLERYEHEVARVCAELESTGFLVDVDYAQGLSAKLEEEQELWEWIAEDEYGIDSVNANRQVADALIESGVKLTKLTDSGEFKVNKEVLDPLEKQGNELVAIINAAKRAKKWRSTWVDTFLETRDGADRCHANINPLRARTARMSITGIPAQTLPATDWTIRRCFIADPGHTIVSCDYQAQELRVLAALSGDQNMINAFKQGADLHQMTADASGVDRSVGKTVNFAYVYGSGAGNIANTCGISVPKAREVIKGFETTYPAVKRLSDKLQGEAKKKGYIVTPWGRVLRVDKERPYSALNYMIQSSSRDITCGALLRLDKAGFTPYLRLPIHDEIVACVPTDKAEWGAKKIAEIMATDFLGLTIASDADVFGPSWGTGYVTDEDREAYEASLK